MRCPSLHRQYLGRETGDEFFLRSYLHVHPQPGWTTYIALLLWRWWSDRGNHDADGDKDDCGEDDIDNGDDDGDDDDDDNGDNYDEDDAVGL